MHYLFLYPTFLDLQGRRTYVCLLLLLLLLLMVML
jgi:hypothetical protein